MLEQRVVPRVRNPALRDAMEAWAEDALGLLDEFLAAGGEAPHVEEDAWVRQGDVFQRERRSVPRWDALARGLRDSLLPRPAAKDALAALRADPVVAPQLDQFIGVGLHRRRIGPTDVLESLVVRLAQGQGEGGSVRFEGPAFAAAYQHLEDALYRPDLTFEAVAPLRNARLDATPVFLAEDLRLDALSDAEVAELLKHGQAEAAEGVAMAPPRFAVKATYHFPKQLPADNAGLPGGLQREAEERVSAVLRAMTVFKAGNVARGAVVHRTHHWFLRDQVIVGAAPRAPPWGSTYTLSRTEAPALARFWAVLQHPRVRQRRSLEVAMRRFRDACGRSRPEDRLIDLLVCAEALSLNVANDSSDRAEMLHRLALRAGSGMAERAQRREFDRAIRAAYLVRDDVVHGHEPRLPPSPDGSPQELEAFIERTEALLRGAMQRAVAIAALGEVPEALDWERIAARLARTPPSPGT
jgi:hypothetical protein